MLARAWAAGAAPAGNRLTVDPDDTRVAVYQGLGILDLPVI